jgi:hypothetical protein
LTGLLKRNNFGMWPAFVKTFANNFAGRVDDYSANYGI